MTQKGALHDDEGSKAPGERITLHVAKPPRHHWGGRVWHPSNSEFLSVYGVRTPYAQYGYTSTTGAMETPIGRGAQDLARRVCIRTSAASDVASSRGWEFEQFPCAPEEKAAKRER